MFDLLEGRFWGLVIFFITAALFIPDRFLKHFRSIRFNVGVFLVIAVVSAIGTFIPQGLSSQEMANKIGPFSTRIFEALQLSNLYHAWWYSALLGLMAFDVVVCKLKHGPMRGYFFSSKKAQPIQEEIQRLSRKSVFKESFSISLPVDTVSAQVAAWCACLRWSHWTNDKTDGKIFYQARHQFQRWGDFILHISIVVILLGGLMGAISGFEEAMILSPGEKQMLNNRPFEIVLHQFEIDYYSSTLAPSLYASDLEVWQNNLSIARKRIVVNDPLDIDGIRFYQASWGMSENFRSVTLTILGQELKLNANQTASLPGLPYSIRARKFFPSFDIDSNSLAVTVDDEGNNPAVLLDFVSDNRTVASLWVFKNHPELAFSENQGKLSRTAAPPFLLSSVDPVLYSGIQVAYDPGAPVFWMGATMLILGLCMHFYFHHRRISIVVSSRAEQTWVHIFGWNSRRPEDFRLEFDMTIKQLKQVFS